MAKATDLTERWRLAELLHGHVAPWLPKLWRGFTADTPLVELDELLTRATRDGDVRACYSSSVRHGKSTLCHAAIVRFLACRPGETVMVATHSQEGAESKARTIRDAAVRAGLRLRRDSSKLSHFTFTNHASVIAAGVGSSHLTGEGCSLLIADDLFGSREQAESAAERDRVDGWWSGTALSRLAPTGSALALGARWSGDDLIGRLIARDWEAHAQPAITDDGRALWPEGGWTLAKLEAVRKEIGEYDFASLYLCAPIPRGGAMVKTAPLTYTADELRRAVQLGARIVVSIDPAAGLRARNDFTAIVVMALLGAGPLAQGFVMEVERDRVELPQLAARVRAQVSKHGASLVLAEAVAGFKGVPQTLRALDRTLRVVEIHPKGDKLTRATPLCAAVESGRVRVPDSRPRWLRDFESELLAFPSAPHDDQVDAAAQAFGLAAHGRVRDPLAELAAKLRIQNALPYG